MHARRIGLEIGREVALWAGMRGRTGRRVGAAGSRLVILEATKELARQSPNRAHPPVSARCAKLVKKVLALLKKDSCGAWESDACHWMPLHYALQAKAPLQLIQALLEACPAAARAIITNSSLHPLHILLGAHQFGGLCGMDCSEADYALRVVRLLLRADPPGVRALDRNRRLPLHYAVHINEDVAQLLLAEYPNGANQADDQGKCPQFPTTSPTPQDAGAASSLAAPPVSPSASEKDRQESAARLALLTWPGEDRSTALGPPVEAAGAAAGDEAPAEAGANPFARAREEAERRRVAREAAEAEAAEAAQLLEEAALMAASAPVSLFGRPIEAAAAAAESDGLRFVRSCAAAVMR